MRGNNFGKRVLVMRKSVGISQRDLADLVGITEGMLSRIEDEDISVDFEVMKKLAFVLRCDLSWLIFGDETEIVHR